MSPRPKAAVVVSAEPCPTRAVLTLRRLADALAAQQEVCAKLGTSDMECAGLMFARFAQLAREGLEP